MRWHWKSPTSVHWFFWSLAAEQNARWYKAKALHNKITRDHIFISAYSVHAETFWIAWLKVILLTDLIQNACLIQCHIDYMAKLKKRTMNRKDWINTKAFFGDYQISTVAQTIYHMNFSYSRSIEMSISYKRFIACKLSCSEYKACDILYHRAQNPTIATYLRDKI